MTVNPWATVRAIFEEVVELPPETREAVLADRCRGDRQLRTAVEELLLADAAPGLLESGAALRLPGFDPLGAGGAGAVIADFTVTRLIGKGGMGSVYEAQQEQPRRAVALKILRPELCSDSALRRFRVEAEILGRLQHPGIAEVYAAGVHDMRSGPFHFEVPWYAMELLGDAEQLTAYARRHALTVAARIALIARVCEAVQHAHSRGVIHRDLKPANVLVDPTGTPKIIDFGVARVTGGSEPAQRTEAGAVVGTPSYMAPEQFSGAAEDVDARCDVWGLGVMLYELLVDRLPFALDTIAPQAAARVFAVPPMRLRVLRADLSVELEWIVARALATDPEHRYPTAAALADDLGRFSRGEAVAAAPPSRTYQLRKTLRRHRGLVAGVAAVMVALLAGFVATASALTRAEADRRTAVQQSERTQGFVQVLRGATARAQGKHRGTDSTIADLLVELEASVDDPGLPALVRSAVVEHVAVQRFSNAEYPQSEVLFRRTLELLAEGGLLGGQEEVLTRAGLSEALRLQARYDDSALELARAVDVARSALAEDDPTWLSLQRRQALALLERGRFDEGIAACRRLLAERRARFGPDAAETAQSVNDLGAALADAGQLDEAATVMREACEVARRVHGVNSEKELLAELNLSTALLKLGRPEEARSLASPTLERARQAIGDRHPITLTLTENVGQALRLTGRAKEAVPILTANLAASSAQYPAHHPRRLGAVQSLALAQLDAGDAAAAAATLEGCRADYADQPEIVQRKLVALSQVRARVLQALERPTEAEAELTAAYERASARLGVSHECARDTAGRLATLLEQLGRPEAAATWRTRANGAGDER